MKKILLLSVVWFLITAQTFTPASYFQAGSIAVNGGIVILTTRSTSNATINLTGSWTGTLQFEASIDNTNWFPAGAIPSGTGAAVTSTTSNGTWTYQQPSSQLRVRASAWTSGTATVNILASAASAPGSGTGGGGGGGTVTNVGTNAPLTGGPITSSGSVSINDFVASGASHARGTVPDPGVTAGTTKFLREDATWVVPAGGGGGTPGGSSGNLQTNNGAGGFGAYAGTGSACAANNFITQLDANGAKVCAAGNAGTVTSVATTAPITGGTITGTGTIAISDFVASGASHARGAVPDPGASAGTTKFLREDATWAAPSGGGNVTAGGTLTSTALVTGAGGSAIQTPSATSTMDASGNISTPGSMTTGNAGGTTGFVALSGGTSGTVTIKPQAAAGTYEFDLPTTAGSSGSPLLSGGGAGSPMTYGTRSGNTTTFATTSGTFASGNCAKFDASGNVVDNGATCGAGGSTTDSSITDDGTNVSMTEQILFTNRAASATPAAGITGWWADTTDKRFHDKNDAGTIGTTVVADAGASNNFLTAISAAGVVSKAQPSFANLSGTTSISTRTSCVSIGANDASAALADSNLGPQSRLFMWPVAMTLTEITVAADAGTPNIQVRKNHGGTTTNLLSAVLATAASGNPACARTATSATCIDGTTSSGSVTLVTASSANVIAAGDWFEFTSGTAGGTAKAFTACATGTVN